MSRGWEYKVADGARVYDEIHYVIVPPDLSAIELQMEFDIEGLKEFLKKAGIDDVNTCLGGEDKAGLGSN